MNSAPITNQAIMEDFFKKNLSLIPNASKLIKLEIFPHDPLLVISHSATLVKYMVTFEKNHGSVSKIELRGSSDKKLERQKAFHVLSALWASGFNTGKFVVPKPLGYFSDLHLLLYENYPARSLMQLFEKGEGDFLPMIQLGWNWLFEFHTRKPQSIPEASFNWLSEDKKFHELTTHLINKFGYQADKIVKLAGKILKKEKVVLDPSSFSLVHGDYQPNNILISKEQTAVIDFNDVFLYDELYDVAYYRVQTQHMLQRIRGLDISTQLQIMENAYLLKRGVELSSQTREKLNLFQARTLMNISVLTSHNISDEIFSEIENYAD